MLIIGKILSQLGATIAKNWARFTPNKSRKPVLVIKGIPLSELDLEEMEQSQDFKNLCKDYHVINIDTETEVYLLNPGSHEIAVPQLDISDRELEAMISEQSK